MPGYGSHPVTAGSHPVTAGPHLTLLGLITGSVASLLALDPSLYWTRLCTGPCLYPSWTLFYTRPGHVPVRTPVAAPCMAELSTAAVWYPENMTNSVVFTDSWTNNGSY